MIEYTEEQQQAVYNTEDDIILGAGAGSGKTRVLVGRYLHLLESQQAGISEILAITFTNKAANEMLERIREEMNTGSQQGGREERHFWYRKLMRLDRAQIGTFHSFAGRVLRENPVAAGLDPDFRIMDEEEADRLLQETIDGVINQGLSEEDQSLLNLAREYGLYHLPGTLEELFAALRQTSLDTSALINRTEHHLTVLHREFDQYKQSIIELGEELLAVFAEEGATGKSVAKMEAFREKWPVIKQALREIEGIEERDRYNLIKEIPSILKGRMSKSVNDLAGALRDMVRDGKLTAYLSLGLWAGIVNPLGEVMSRLEAGYARLKQERQVLDFADLELKLTSLLEESPELLHTLQDRYSYLMVDEFQDNSPRQKRLINLLAGGERTNLFLVGDPKQSIYRFRGADVTVFNRQRQEIMDQGGVDLRLSKNFRSREGLLTFVNFLFSRLMGAETGEHFVDYSPLEADRTGGEDNLELLLIERDSLEEDDYRKAEAYHLAERIKELTSGREEGSNGVDREEVGINYGDIAILMQSLTGVGIYEEALQAHGIPYVVVKGHGFFEQQEVKDILNLLKVIDNRRQLLPLAGLLRSPFCGLNDRDLYLLFKDGDPWSKLTGAEKVDEIAPAYRRQIQRLAGLLSDGRRWKDSLTVTELLSRLLEQGNYRESLVAGPYYRQRWANLNKLLSMINEYEDTHLPSVRGVIDYLEEKRETYNREGLARLEEEGGNLVQLMSIHQAKGLEFPVVILPDSQRQIFSHLHVGSVLLDENNGLGLKLQYQHDGQKTLATPLYQQLYQREKNTRIAENQRLFYVAATRARDHLIISGSARRELQCADCSRAGSWLEWLAWACQTNLMDVEDSIIFQQGGRQGRLRVNIASGDPEKPDNSPAVQDEQVITGAGLPVLSSWDNTEEWYRLAPLAAPVPWVESERRKDLSVTALLTYRNCPRQYYLKYRRGLPEYRPEQPGFDGQMDQAGSNPGLDPLAKGTLVHRICELSPKLLAAEPGEGVGSGGQRIEKGLQELIDQTALELGLGGISSGVRSEITEMVLSYRQRERVRRQNYGEIQWEAREQDFLLQFDRFRMVGKIDHLICFADGSGEIIDLKTNQIGENRLSAVEEYYRLQLEAYALAAHHCWGLVPVTGRIDFLLPGLVTGIDFDRGALHRLNRRLEQLGEGILTSHREEDFPPGDEDRCEYCLYGYLCPGRGSS